MRRYAEIDWLRGLMLVLMTVTHLPTWYSSALGQPFGFVSAAEGFVFVSAFLVGCVYGRVAREQGVPAMRTLVWRRAGKIYLAHLAVLLFLLLVLVPLAVGNGAHAITDLASFYRAHPREALVGGALLVYNPPLLDILPMYVLFMAASPLVLAFGMQRGWGRILLGSALIWLLAQFDAGRVVYDAVAAATNLSIPYRETGAFSFLAWQMIWIAGLCIGAQTRPARRRRPLPRGMLLGAAAVALVFFVWRHVAGQVPGEGGMLGYALDKWHLGALRLLDFAALLVLVVSVRDTLAARAQNGSVLVTLGKASLTVFCAHLLICLGALAAHGEAVVMLRWQDSALLAGTLLTLYLIARAQLAGRRLAQPLLSARPAPRTAR